MLDDVDVEVEMGGVDKRGWNDGVAQVPITLCLSKSGITFVKCNQQTAELVPFPGFAA